MFKAGRVLRVIVPEIPKPAPSTGPAPPLAARPELIVTAKEMTFAVRPRPRWEPHERLLQVTSIPRLEYYLKCSERHLGWLRSKIAGERKNALNRKRFRINIARHVKMIDWIIDRIHALKGTSRINRLLPENIPTFTHENPSIQSITVTHRVKRDYDYPHKQVFDAIVDAENKNAKEVHEAYKKAYSNI